MIFAYSLQFEIRISLDTYNYDRLQVTRYDSF